MIHMEKVYCKKCKYLGGFSFTFCRYVIKNEIYNKYSGQLTENSVICTTSCNNEGNCKYYKPFIYYKKPFIYYKILDKLIKMIKGI